MKKRLLKILICPECLPKERKLNPNISEEKEHDIIEGSLSCAHCARTYPIKNGIAFLEPAPPHKTPKVSSKYEEAPVLSSYMWSHYGDLLQDENVSCAYQDWSDLMRPSSGMAIDAGSAVGRFTFEMSRKNDFVVGIDNSHAFIGTARELMLKHEKEIRLQREGLVTRKTTVKLPEHWKKGNMEFLVGDAQALPFRSETFSSLASLNLLDKVPMPMRHLKEMNRVAKPKEAQFLFSDPFSWSEEVTEPENWLGGTHEGPYAGAGMDNVIRILSGRENGLSPQWNIEKQGHVWWKIRTHQNHFELIRSCFVTARR